MSNTYETRPLLGFGVHRMHAGDIYPERVQERVSEHVDRVGHRQSVYDALGGRGRPKVVDGHHIMWEEVVRK